MLMEPIELSILLERLEFSQKNSSRLLGRITVGSSVTIKNRETREKLTVTLVPPELAEPEEQMISFISPLGSALLGLKLGDVAVTEFGRRTDKWDVISVNCVFRSIRTAIPASFGQAFRCRPDKLILTSHDFLFT